jgi:hypothetical protein
MQIIRNTFIFRVFLFNYKLYDLLFFFYYRRVYKETSNKKNFQNLITINIKVISKLEYHYKEVFFENEMINKNYFNLFKFFIFKYLG